MDLPHTIVQNLFFFQIHVSELFETDHSTFNVTLKTDAIAPFVWLDSATIPGRFSDNGFTMITDNLVIQFYSKNEAKLEDIFAKLKVTSLKDTCVN